MSRSKDVVIDENGVMRLGTLVSFPHADESSYPELLSKFKIHERWMKDEVIAMSKALEEQRKRVDVIREELFGRACDSVDRVVVNRPDVAAKMWKDSIADVKKKLRSVGKRK